MAMAEPMGTDTGGLPEPTDWTDALTGLEGPQFWRKMVITEVARATRYKRPMTVIILDVDGIDRVTSVWGVDTARHTLRETAQCLRRMARTSDHLARIGSARFGILLTETDEIAAINFIERIRAAGSTSVPRTADLIRLVFGWASPKPGEVPETLVRRAEERMASDEVD
jgi:diguanylate cyclase (GGDEF)-like protein